MVITGVENGSPDTTLVAFDGKLHEKKDEIPPEAHRRLKTLKKNNVEKVDHQKVEKKQCRKSGFIDSYIRSYTPIYIKISNIRKTRINIKHKNGHNSGPRASPRVQI